MFADAGKDNKFNSRRHDLFDVDGFHPNISPSRGNPQGGYDYATKDGDVVAGGLERPEREKGGQDRRAKDADRWDEITSATTASEFWDRVHRLDPKAAACNFTQLQRYVDWAYKPDDAAYVHPELVQFKEVDDGRVLWLSQSGLGSNGESGIGRPKSLVLWGPTRTGKTVWARSLGEHIYCVGLVSGSECMKAEEVEYAVFDDIRGGIKFFPAFKEWLGGQMNVTVKQLYKEPKLVTWGKPSIWISNTDPRAEMTYDDVLWMEENCIFVEITNSIIN